MNIVLLTDTDPDYMPNEYRSGRWGSEIRFRFPVIKLLDYKNDWNRLESNQNPFTMVVMAHFKAQELGKGREAERKQWKLYLVKMLYERGYSRQDILELFRFIDWLLVLPSSLERAFMKDLRQIEEGKQMPHITSVERIGIEQGKLEATQEILIDILTSRFGSVPEDIFENIKNNDKYVFLKNLVSQAVICEDIKTFHSLLK